MKKVKTLITLALVLCMVLPSAAFASPTGITQNPTISMNLASPVIDGTIETDGSWSGPALFNEATVWYFWCSNSLTSAAYVYFAYDENGLYFAADITDNSSSNKFVAATGYDDIDNSGSSRPYGWNGDVFALMIDPLGAFERSSLSTTVWYDVGMYADGSVHVYRSQFREGDVTSTVTAAGARTTNGWRFEAMIPWSEIAADAKAMNSSSTVTAANLYASGATTRVAAMYMDRYTRGSTRDTWGRFITVCQRTYDGYGGWQTSGITPKAYGIKISNSGSRPHTFTDWTTTASATCTTAGTRTRTCTDCGLVETQTIAALGHAWGDWTVITQPTSSSTGEKRRVCARCGAVETKTIAAYSTDPIVVAYYNSQYSYYLQDLQYVDVVNYHPFNNNSSSPYVNGSINASSFNSTKTQMYSYNPDIKILFTFAICNYLSSGFEANCFGSQTNRQALADELVSYVSTYGFDGIDIDYEFPSSPYSYRNQYVLFVQYLRSRLDALSGVTGKDYYLTLAVPAGNWAYSLFDIEALEPYVDWFNIMNYDLYCGSNFTNTHHHTPPYDSFMTGGSVSSDIALYLSHGIPADKIVPGCGMYSRKWTGVEPGSTGTGLNQTGTIDSSNIHYDALLSSYVNKNGFVRYWDDTAKAPYLYNSSSKTFLSYDDEESVTYKCDIVVENGVRGLMVFDFCTCDGTGIFALIDEQLSIPASQGPHVHNYVETARVPAACGAQGSVTYTCTGCGDSYTETLAALEHSFGNWTSVPAEDCQHYLKSVRTCSLCGSQETRELPMTGPHAWGDWTVTVQPSCQRGSKTRTCTLCGKTESSPIVATGQHVWGDPVVTPPAPINYPAEDNAESGSSVRTCSVCGATTSEGIRYFTNDGYKIVINNAAGVNYIRVAEGVYTTAADIKNNVSLSIAASAVQANTVDGVFSYELEAGTYSLWIRYDGGAEYILSGITNTDMTPEVTDVYGLYATISNLYNVQTMRIAKGSYDNAADVKANVMITQTANALAGRHEYTALLDEPGDYTAWISFADERDPVFLYFTSEVTVPVFEQEGMRVRVSDLVDVTNMRMATGTYETNAEIKAASDVSAYTPNKALKNRTDWTFQFMYEGDYTIIVQYNNGYREVKHVHISRLAPTVDKGAITVTFSGLSGHSLGIEPDVIRYVPGTYSDKNRVKTAPGAAYIKGSALNGADSYTFFDLLGAYTFVVQFTDGSVNVYNYTFADYAKNFTVSRAFGDHMTVQRDKQLSVWGWADPSDEGKSVKVDFKGETAYGTVENGEWKAVFDATFPASATPATITVSGDESAAPVVISDVLVGDVYYIMGQSNVHWSTGMLQLDLAANNLHDLDDVSFDNSTNIRLFRNSHLFQEGKTGEDAWGTAKVYEDVDSPQAVWARPSDFNANSVYDFNTEFIGGRSFSAVGYLFAYNLAQETDVPIAMIEIDASGYPLTTFAPNELADKWHSDVMNTDTGVYYLLVGGQVYPLQSRMAFNQQIYPLQNFS